MPDPLYAREIGRGALQRVDGDFVATLDDAPTANGLSPYVRYHYWAEVRLPPERRVPQGVIEEPLPAGAIAPLQAAQQQDSPGAFSEISAPAMAMFIPADVPALASGNVTATVGAGAAPGAWRLTLNVANGPLVNPRAVGLVPASPEPSERRGRLGAGAGRNGVGERRIGPDRRASRTGAGAERRADAGGSDRTRGGSFEG